MHVGMEVSRVMIVQGWRVGNADEELRDEGFFFGSSGVFAGSDGRGEGEGGSGGVKGCYTIRCS